MADVESKSIPHELPSSHWLKATGQCVLERYLSATMNVRYNTHLYCLAVQAGFYSDAVVCLTATQEILVLSSAGTKDV